MSLKMTIKLKGVGDFSRVCTSFYLTVVHLYIYIYSATYTRFSA